MHGIPNFLTIKQGMLFYRYLLSSTRIKKSVCLPFTGTFWFEFIKNSLLSIMGLLTSLSCKRRWILSQTITYYFIYQPFKRQFE